MRLRLFHLLVLISFGSQLRAQETPVKKPSYVIIADGHIITKQQFDAYAKGGYVTGMAKGVSQAKRDSLAQKLGDSVGDRQFIVLVTLASEEERAERARKAKLVKPDSARSAETTGKMTQSPLIGKPPADFRVSMSDGQDRQLSSLKGKVIMVNFWATWCAPCIMEFYDFPDKIIKAFSDKPFALLPISKAESKEVVLAKMARLAKDGIRFPVGWDTDNAIWGQLGGSEIPRTILIDKKGVVRYVVVGGGEDNLASIIQEIGKLVNE